MSKFGADCIRVDQVSCYFDPSTSTKVTEKPYLVQYESQHFKCKVLVELDESVADSSWTIGLIQACSHMYLENRYGKYGSSFWEFHPLKTKVHKMVNDSDGRQYPFYSLTSSKCEVARGSVHGCMVKLQFADHFYPTVAWDLPYCGSVRLTDIVRRQEFWIWLVAIRRASSRGGDVFDCGRDQLHVLRTMRWQYDLHMEFDPQQRVGKRLTRVSDEQTHVPAVVSPRSVPLSAVHPPHCNAAQSLLWQPQVQGEKLDLLVPPRQTVVPWQQWVSDMMPGAGRVQKPKDLQLCPLWQKDSRVSSAQAAGSGGGGKSGRRLRRLLARSASARAVTGRLFRVQR